ncbi:porin [Caballeronia insecticola]|uniref:Outer membrane porin OmpC family n=1 Tax=Caballeronia insecticola TaxID=758793 RepID=R4X3G3_9BURK|nr:porin [Caballeronia insecticola]BAN26342.1 outer membrane porin OmpC family [Caballeronia insecticola]
MKKAIVVAISALAATTAAHAQTSVTLYGLIDVGLMYTNNVERGTSHGPLYQATSGEINGSRFGLRGSEDLGGGLHAIFLLENGFNAQNGKLGQNNRLFGRQAYVGLASEQFGAVTLGRQYDFVTDFVAPLSGVAATFGDTGFAHPFDNDTFDHTLRINNAIKFTSVDYHGLKFGGMYGFSNSPSFADNRAYSVGLTYAVGHLNVAVAYLQFNGSDSASGTAGAVDPAESPSNGVGGFEIGADVQRTVAAAANYTYGAAVFGFAYSHSQFQNTHAFGSNNGTLIFDNYEISGKYAVTQTFNLGASYTYTDGHLTQSATFGSDPKWSQINLQAIYSLSKRTDVYAEAMYQHAIGHGYVAFVSNSGGASSTSNQVVGTVGMRTRF